MRRHPYICTGCAGSFEKFKLLRRHWRKGDCADETAGDTLGDTDDDTVDNTADNTAGGTSVPSPATQSSTRRQIDPCLNLWLNNDDDYSRLDDTIWVDDDDDDDNNDDDDDENDDGNAIYNDDDGEDESDDGDCYIASVPEIASPRMSERPGQIDNDTRDELLYTLLDVVEKLSDRVLGIQTTHSHTRRSQHAYSDIPHCQLQTTNSAATLHTTNNWTTVPGNPKATRYKPAHNPPEISNKYELLQTISDVHVQETEKVNNVSAPGGIGCVGSRIGTTSTPQAHHQRTIQNQPRPSATRLRQAASAHQPQRSATRHIQPEELSAALATAQAAAPVQAPGKVDSAGAPGAARSKGSSVGTTSAPSAHSQHTMQNQFRPGTTRGRPTASMHQVQPTAIHHVQPEELSAALATALGAAPVQAPGRVVSPAPSTQNQVQSAASRHNQRPQVVINRQPDSDNAAWRKTVPGNSSFAGAVKNGQKVALFSDSICNRMNKHELRKKLQCNIDKKSFPGATTNDMYEHYMMPTLKRNTPDTAIIHIGVNDILAKGTPDGGLTANSIEQIAKDVIRCGEVCQSAGVNTICISSILTFRGRRAQSTINHINNQLAKLCTDKSFDFLLNDNISMDRNNTLYYGDGLHLNDVGRDVLMENFRSYLRKD